MKLKYFFDKYFRRDNQRNHIFKFSISMGLIVLLFLLSIFTGLMLNNKRMIEKEMLTRARAHFGNIVLTRSWNALYGGVYIEKTEGIESNPYLKNPDIETIDGIIYTKKNPALMTREISELAVDQSEYQFRITSLNPINPANTPDAFETMALMAFEDDISEIYQKEEIGEDIFYRYMGPLVTEKSCLPCHREQGYKEGDIRGGISVGFRINDIDKSLKHNRNIILLLSITTTVILLGIFYFLIFRLNRNLKNALQQIKDLAEKDSLTGLYNRRYLFEWAEVELFRSIRYKYEISIILLDIDFFKKINDIHGHKSGDITLIRFASIMEECSRKSDLVVRYGGEEFLIILTNTGQEGALKFAEILLNRIRKTEIRLSGEKIINVTASLGISSRDFSRDEQNISLEELIDLADRAMYKAKKNGRDRIEVL